MAMWRKKEQNYGGALRGFSTPPATWKNNSMRNVHTLLPTSESKLPSFDRSFNVIHRLPAVDSPYARAKRVQVSLSFFVCACIFISLYY